MRGSKVLLAGASVPPVGFYRRKDETSGPAQPSSSPSLQCKLTQAEAASAAARDSQQQVSVLEGSGTAEQET